MSFRCRLRVELPDQPGALSRLTDVLARSGGNLVAIDVQDVEDDAVVDEIVLDMPDDLDVEQLRRTLSSEGVGTLVSFQSGQQDLDPVLRSLRWASTMATADASIADEVLERLLAEAAGTSSAWVCGREEAMAFEAGRLSLARGAAVSRLTGDAPPRRVHGEIGDVWILAVPDLVGPQQRVAFVARPATDRFT